MPTIKSTEYERLIKSDKICPVYLLAGEETFVSDKIVKHIQNILKTDSLNTEVFYGSEATAGSIFSASQTLPFLADKRLIIIKDSHKMKAAELSKVPDIFASPSASSCVVFVWPEKVKNEDKRSKMFSFIEDSGMVIECKALYDREASSWLVKKAKEYNKSISMEACEYIIDENGTALGELDKEMEKALLFCNDKNEITIEDVEMLSGHTKQVNLNVLSESIETKQIKRSIEIVERLIEEGEMPLIILSSIYRVIRRLLEAKALIDEKKLSYDDLFKVIRMHPYYAKLFYGRLSKFTKKELINAVSKIKKADLMLKSSSVGPSLIFEELLVNLFAD